MFPFYEMLDKAIYKAFVFLIAEELVRPFIPDTDADAMSHNTHTVGRKNVGTPGLNVCYNGSMPSKANLNSKWYKR